MHASNSGHSAHERSSSRSADHHRKQGEGERPAQREQAFLVVILVQAEEDTPLTQALRAVASNEPQGDMASVQVDEVVREAYLGGTVLPPSVAGAVLHALAHSSPQSEYNLTLREKEVLRLMGEGRQQKQIADALCLSPHTVDNHIRSIYGKLQVHSAVEAVAKAIRERLI